MMWTTKQSILQTSSCHGFIFSQK